MGLNELDATHSNRNADRRANDTAMVIWSSFGPRHTALRPIGYSRGWPITDR